MWDLTRYKNKKKFHATKPFEPRIKLMAWIFVIFGLLIIFKLFDFQVLKFDFYYALASDQHEIYQKLFPERGSIYLKDFVISELTQEDSIYPLAINKDYNLVYAQPKYLGKDPQEIVDLILPILQPDEERQEELREELLSKLGKEDDPYEPLMHKVEDSQAVRIKELEIKGIRSTKETFRYYPEKNIGSNVLGFVGFDAEGFKRGLYGIEGYFDEQLGGKQGEFISEKDI